MGLLTDTISGALHDILSGGKKPSSNEENSYAKFVDFALSKPKPTEKPKSSYGTYGQSSSCSNSSSGYSSGYSSEYIDAASQPASTTVSGYDEEPYLNSEDAIRKRLQRVGQNRDSKTGFTGRDGYETYQKAKASGMSRKNLNELADRIDSHLRR